MNDLGELTSSEVIQIKTALLGRIDLLQERFDFGESVLMNLM